VIEAEVELTVHVNEFETLSMHALCMPGPRKVLYCVHAKLFHAGKD